MQTAQSVTGAHPYISLVIDLNTCNIFVGQTVSLTEACEFAALQIIAVEALAGSSPHAPSLVFLDGIDLDVADDAVVMECIGPASRLNVQAGQTDAGTHIETFAVG